MPLTKVGRSSSAVLASAVLIGLLAACGGGDDTSSESTPSPSATAECPQCRSADTVEVSRFGATPCKAQWRCNACLEPFERFKCH